jgi:hypothetical protein
MNELPLRVRPALRRLSRRLAIGLFLDVWPPWAAGSLFLAGLVALVCRMFVPGAASRLPWLWLAPILTALPPSSPAMRAPTGRPKSSPWLIGSAAATACC